MKNLVYYDIILSDSNGDNDVDTYKITEGETTYMEEKQNKNELIDKMIEKSQEAFLLAIEIYNKPTIKYRLEGFAFFICNAWELLLKSYILKNNDMDSLYFKNKPERTIGLSDCIKKYSQTKKTQLEKI